MVTMSARFTRLESVSLGEEESEGEEGGGEGYSVKLVLTDGRRGGRRERKQWRKRGRGRACISSWRWVLIALIAFSVSIIVSLMVSKLTSEPPPIEETTTSLKGKYTMYHPY